MVPIGASNEGIIMSETATGTVQRIYTKDIAQGTIYSIKLVGDDRYYGFYTNKPECNEGDQVSFSWKQSGNFCNAAIKSFKVTGKGTGAPVAASGGGGGGSRDDYWAKKEQYEKKVTHPHLNYRSATMGAIDLVCAALAHDCLPLGQKKGERMDILRQEVAKTRDWLYTTYSEATEKLEKGESLIPPNIAEGAENHTPEEGWVDEDIPF